MTDLEVDGFVTEAFDAGKPRLQLLVEGDTGTGKTHLGLTAPGPIAYQGLDMGHAGVIEKFESGEATGEVVRVVKQFPVYVPPDRPRKMKDSEYEKLVGQSARIVWREAERGWKSAVNSADIKTFVQDTQTEAWDVLRLARFGRLSQVPPNLYSFTNAEFKALLRMGQASDKNIIAIYHTEDEWATSKKKSKTGKAVSEKTGNTVRAGFKKVERYFPTVIRMAKRKNEDGVLEMFGTFVKSRLNRELEGEELVEPSFLDIAMAVFPESDPEEWGS